MQRLVLTTLAKRANIGMMNGQRMVALTKPTLKTQFRAVHAKPEADPESNSGSLWWLLSAAGFALLGIYYSASTAKAKEQTVKEFTPAEVAKHTTPETGIWVSYKGKVYDITKFMDLHPGGRVISLAAGQDLEPFWAMYTIHTANDVPFKMLEPFEIGKLKTPALGLSAAVPCLVSGGKDKPDDYDFVLPRHPLLSILSRKPFNAEPPSELLSATFVTPPDIGFVRSHIHTPKLDAKTWTAEITGLGLPKPITITLKDLQNEKLFPRHTVMAAMQCAGNRRETLAAVSKPDSPLAYRHMVMSNCHYTGVRIRDVLKHYGFDVDKAKAEGAKHFVQEGYDHNGVEPFGTSCTLDKALDPDSLIVWQMNGQDLLPDHGYPVRTMIPGIGGQRSLKWLKKIVISPIESQSFWQQKDKVMPPWNPKPEDNPAFQEMPVNSAICDPANRTQVPEAAEEITLKGYSWSGGGRGIMRVDITTDHGKTWQIAKLHPPPGQEPGRIWGWTLWDVTLPLPKVTGYEQTMQVCSRAVDMSYNSQPESPLGLINQRGFMCNSWHCIDLIRPPKKNK